MPKINEVNELVNRLMAEGTERNPAECTECGEPSVVKNECQNCIGQQFGSDFDYQHSCLEDGCDDWYMDDEDDIEIQVTDLYELSNMNHPWTVWELGQRGLPLSQAKIPCEICFTPS